MRSWLTRKARWLTAGLGIVIMTAAIPITAHAYEGVWTGLGPKAQINGHQLNVRVEWEQGYACDIENSIRLKIIVPKRSEYFLGGDSAGRFDCNGDGIFDSVLMTKTEIVEGRRNSRVRVVAMVSSPQKVIPTRISLFKDSELAKVCNGISNRRVWCRGPSF